MDGRDDDDEEQLLRSVALKNANSILVARQRAEQELLAAKEELHASNARITSILESITDGFIVVDDGWRFTYLNPRAADLLRPFQASPEALLGRSLWEACPALVGSTLDAHYRRAVSDQAAAQFELHDAQRGTWLEVRAYPTAGALTSYFHDITRRKNDEQALRSLYEGAQRSAVEREALLESERAARTEVERASHMKDEFLSILSHELRTPLTAILGWSNLLRSKAADAAASPADLARGLETIERNARTQNQLIEDLLDMSRIASGKVRLDIQPLAPVAFIEAAIETVRPAAEAREIRIEKLLDPTAGPINGDPNRLQQVIWNLLANAIKFTPKGGKVQVVLERVNSHIEISVADTGQGIEPEFLPFVFERFRQADSSTTRKHGGLGLGLSIVKHLVELHGGTVHARSAGDGQGATFAVHLPVAVMQRSTANDRVHPKGHSLSDFKVAELAGVTVLVVDDEDDARELVRSLLTMCGARVVTAANATEALALVQGERPDVVVSDIGMPDVDGYELLRRIRALGAAGKVPAIALTTFARTEDRTRALRAGYLVHVSKPVEPAEFVATVASIVGRTGR